MRIGMIVNTIYIKHKKSNSYELDFLCLNTEIDGTINIT